MNEVNCRSCNLIPCPYIEELEQESDTAYFIFDQIEKVGCLSHPGAREWLMRDVVKELERLSELQKRVALNDYESKEVFTYQMVALEKSNVLDMAISLIRGDNK